MQVGAGILQAGSVVSSKLLRTFLDDAWDQAQASDRGLREQLRTFESQARQTLGGGSLVSTSANGRHVALAQSGAGQITQVEVCAAWRRLIDVYDQVTIDLGVAGDGRDRAVDTLIKTTMMTGYLREVMGAADNFMYLTQ